MELTLGIDLFYIKFLIAIAHINNNLEPFGQNV